MIRARFTAECILCERLIQPNEPIELTPGNDWVHSECIDEDGIYGSGVSTWGPRTVCPTCHTLRTVTGACMCDPEEDQ